MTCRKVGWKFCHMFGHALESRCCKMLIFSSHWQAYSIWKYQQFPFSAYEKRRSETKKGPTDSPVESAKIVLNHIMLRCFKWSAPLLISPTSISILASSPDPWIYLSGKKLWKNKGVGRARMGSMPDAEKHSTEHQAEASNCSCK